MGNLTHQRFHLFSSETKNNLFENTIKWTLRYTKIGILLILQFQG